MTQAEYRIIEFPTKDGPKFVGLAWNYDEAVMITTPGLLSYTSARKVLDDAAKSANVELRWFDGLHKYDPTSGQILPLPNQLLWKDGRIVADS